MIKDLLVGIRRWELWTRLAWNEIKSKYRRSVVGPIWASLSFGIFVGALGLLYAQLFNQDPSIYVPHLVLGLLVWNIVSQMMMDGCLIFSNMRMYILEANIPLTVFIFVLLWKNIILFFFNAIVFILVIFIFDIQPNTSWIYSLPALLLILFNTLWIALLFAIISARFHDFNEVVGNAMRIIFFITPILWLPGMEGRFTLMLDANPFYYLIEIFRGYLIGNEPSVTSWLAVVGLTIVGWAATSILYNKYRYRIVFWL